MMLFRGGFGEYEMYAIGTLSVKIFLLISVMSTFYPEELLHSLAITFLHDTLYCFTVQNRSIL